MIGRLVSFALKQRFMIVAASIALMVYGAISFRNLPIDAYPDLSPPHVEIITQWPGHAAEEIERLVTIPVEDRDERHSAPGIAALDFAVWAVVHRDEFRIRRRSVFRARTGLRTCGRRDLARRALRRAFRRSISPSGLIYRYVLQSPDRSPQRFEDASRRGCSRGTTVHSGRGGRFRFRRHDHAVSGAAGPNKLSLTGFPCRKSCSSSSNNNANSGGGFYSQGGQFYYIRGLGLVRDTDDIGNIVVAENNGTPVYVRDVAQVQIGHAVPPRAVRIHEAARSRRGRHPDARRRAGAGDPKAGRGR